MQLNAWFFVVLVALVLLWKVDFVSTLLNLRSLSPEVPEAFRDVVDESSYAKSQEYTRARAVFSLASSGIGLVVFIAFWWFGGFGWLDERVRSLGHGETVTGLIVIGGLFLAWELLISLPLDAWSTFVIEERFGFNRTGPGTFLADRIKGLVLAGVIGLPLLALILWLFRSVPLAWVWGWVAVTLVSLFLAYVAPAWILPLFNRFEPLEDDDLKQAIHALSERCDFPIEEVSVMDGSKRSTKSNAFFTGFGKHKRIALFDTLIERQTRDELIAVLAHEIGHYRKHHILKNLVLGCLTTGAMFFLLGWFLENRGLFDAFGVKHTSIYLSLVFFGILLQPVNRALSVATLALSRKHEYEADAYAAEITGRPGPMISALKKLSRDNLTNLTPDPFYVLLHYTHPPVLQRIEALRGEASPEPAALP